MQDLHSHQDGGEKNYCIYVISLQNAKARRESVVKQLESTNIAWKFVDAIEEDHDLVEKIARDQKASIYWHKVMVKGEIACYLSHVKSWEIMRDDKVEYGLILEDDFFLKADLKQIIGCMLAIQSDYDMVKLFGTPKFAKTIEKVAFQSLSIQILRAFSVTGISVAQWVRADALPLLIAKASEMKRPVDMDLKHYWEYPLKILHIHPILVDEISADLGGSMISNRKSPKTVRTLFYQWAWKLCFYKNCVRGWIQ